MKKTLPEPGCCLWPRQAKLEPGELWQRLEGDLWGTAGACCPVCHNLSRRTETWASPFPALPPTSTDALVPQLLNGALHHHLQPIRKHRPTVISLSGQGRRAAFLPTVSVRMPMSLCCSWRLGLKTCCLATHDCHGRSTCQQRWPTTSAMTSTIVQLNNFTLNVLVLMYKPYFIFHYSTLCTNTNVDICANILTWCEFFLSTGQSSNAIMQFNQLTLFANMKEGNTLCHYRRKIIITEVSRNAKYLRKPQ